MSQFPWTVLQTQSAISLFVTQPMIAFVLIETVFVVNLEMFKLVEDVFKLSASAVAVEFCERVWVGLMYIIPYRK